MFLSFAARERVRDLASMDGAVLLAFVASIGNMLQGWDNASIAGDPTISSLIDVPFVCTFLFRSSLAISL